MSVAKMPSEAKASFKVTKNKSSAQVTSPVKDLALGKKKKTSVVARRPNILSLKMSGINMSSQLNNWGKVFENCL